MGTQSMQPLRCFLLVFLFGVHPYSCKEPLTHAPVSKPNKLISPPSWTWVESFFRSAIGALCGCVNMVTWPRESHGAPGLHSVSHVS